MMFGKVWRAMRRVAATRRDRRTIVGVVAWAGVLAILGLFSNGCGVSCAAACEETVDRCGGALQIGALGPTIDDTHCGEYCDRGGSWGECFECMNDEDSCEIRCERDDSCRARDGVFQEGEGG